METKKIFRKPLGNPRRKWRQDHFVLSTFNGLTDDLEKGLKNAKELGFTMIETGWGRTAETDRACLICRDIGLGILTQDVTMMGSFQRPPQFQKRGFLDEGRLSEYEKRIAGNPSVRGFYLWDEPVSADELADARRQLDLFEERFPGLLGFTVAYPHYGGKIAACGMDFVSYIHRFVKELSPAVFSIDLYPFDSEDWHTRRETSGYQLDEHLFYRDLGLLRKLALEQGAPLWYYFQAQDGPAKYRYGDFSAEKLRMTMNLGLLHGTAGLQSYNIFDSALLRSGEKGPLFDATMELNRRALAYGEVMMALRSLSVCHSDGVLKNDSYYQTVIRDRLDDSPVFAGTVPEHFSVGEFCDCEGNRYAFIMNRDYERMVCGRLELRGEYRIYEVSGIDGSQQVICGNTRELRLGLAAGDAVFYRLQRSEETPFLIEYELG